MSTCPLSCVHALGTCSVPSLLTDHHSSVLCTSQMCHVTTSWWPAGAGTTYSAAHFCLCTCTPWHVQLFSVPEMRRKCTVYIEFLHGATENVPYTSCFTKYPGNVLEMANNSWTSLKSHPVRIFNNISFVMYSAAYLNYCHNI